MMIMMMVYKFDLSCYHHDGCDVLDVPLADNSDTETGRFLANNVVCRIVLSSWCKVCPKIAEYSLGCKHSYGL